MWSLCTVKWTTMSSYIANELILIILEYALVSQSAPSTAQLCRFRLSLNVLLTCRQFHNVGLQVFYSEIYISRPTRIIQLINILHQHLSLCAYVKGIELNLDDPE